MKYESAKTEKGNVGVSWESQEEADAQAKMMDESNCTNCTNCDNCIDCTYCTNCTNCTNCDNCDNCDNCTNCYSCYSCYSCNNCTYCTYCNNCTHCTGILIWKGAKAASLKALNGLNWPVTTNGISIQIGCQHHTIEQWKQFSDEAIAKMDKDALTFWNKYKNLILLFVEDISK